MDDLIIKIHPIDLASRPRALDRLGSRDSAILTSVATVAPDFLTKIKCGMKIIRIRKDVSRQNE